MTSIITDYFAAEEAILERLKTELADVIPATNFFTPFSVGGMVENSQPSPAIHVVYSGDIVVAPDNQNSANKGKLIGQRWLIIIAVRSAGAQLQNTQSLRQAAGPIIPKLLDAMQGWAPVSWMRPLGRVTGPAAGYSSAFAYFPFMFEGRIIT